MREKLTFLNVRGPTTQPWLIPLSANPDNLYQRQWADL